MDVGLVLNAGVLADFVMIGIQGFHYFTFVSKNGRLFPEYHLEMVSFELHSRKDRQPSS
jgi:hypothetical protein